MKSSCLIIALLIVVTSSTAQEIIRKPEEGGVVTAKESGVLMSCSYNKTDSETNAPLPITWSYVVDDEETEVDDDQITVTEDGTSKLWLKENIKPGLYRCAVDGLSSDFEVKLYFKLERWDMSHNVIQGEDLKLFCTLKPESDSEGNLTFVWYTKPEDAEDPKSNEGRQELISGETTSDIEPHYKIFNRSDGSVLKIEDAEYSDRGYFQCEVTNDKGKKASVQTMVRVKDKYAALYPFAGIVAEVLVLCLVIFICERRRTSKEAREAAEDDDAEEEFNGAAGNSSVRHRRT